MILTSTCFSYCLIFRLRACTYVMKVTASEVLAVSTECCSSSCRDYNVEMFALKNRKHISNTKHFFHNWDNLFYLGYLRVEVLHVLAQHLSKLAEYFFVPGVIL